jgi:hypothetical protein
LVDLESDLVGIGAQVVDTEIVLQGFVARELVLVGTDDPVFGAARGGENQLSDPSGEAVSNSNMRYTDM